MAINVGILGSGAVAQVLARGFAEAGHTVHIGSREPSKLAEFSNATGIPAGTFASVASTAELVVLAVKGTAAESVVADLSEQLAGRTVIDTTNPIADAPPENGVLRYFTDANDSLMERLQRRAPQARFVKAWNSVGNPFMIHPTFPGGRPTMFICGNDADAKALVASLLEGFGWSAEDMGSAASARAIEPLCQLWCARGFLSNQWNHAFALLKG